MLDDRSDVRATTTARTPGGPPLLASRMSPALLPEPVVLRPRLARLLDDAVARPVTLLRAPAGWGKTTLLASWRRTVVENEPDAPAPAWVSVEAGDDADRLWGYLAAALRSIVDVAADPATMPIPDRPPRPDELEVLAAALAARERPAVLVLDDLHRVTDPAALAGLEFLLRHTEQRLRLVVTGRSAPPLAVQRLRLAGELTEIGPNELAFTGDEIADLLAAHGAAVPVAAVRRLRQRTEGWPAALRIAALALRSQPDPERWIDQLGADQPEIAGYLREEVLAGLAPQDRELLRRAAVADTVCAGLAHALVGDATAEGRLSALADDAGLLHPDGGHPPWYRCHPLLTDLLQRELGRLPADELRDLHLRAGSWYAGNGRPADALRHALAAGDWVSAADLFVTRWPELVPYDRVDRTGPPPAPPPLDAVARDPELALACAAERALHGDPRAAEAQLRLAAEHGRSLPEPRRDRFGRLVAAVELTLARLAGDPATVRAAAARLLATGTAPTSATGDSVVPVEDAGALRTDASDDADVRAVAGIELARLALDAGELTEAADGFGAALTAARVAGRPRPELVSASRWALLAALRGQLRAAEETARAALALPPCQGWSAQLDCGYAYLALALVALHRDQPAEAEANLTLAAPALGEPPAGALAAWCRSYLRHDEGDLTAAHRLLGAARECWSGRSGPLETWLLAADVDLHSARGDLSTARELATAGLTRPTATAPSRPPVPATGPPGSTVSGTAGPPGSTLPSAGPSGSTLPSAGPSGSTVSGAAGPGGETFPAAALSVAAARVELRAGDPHAAARLLPDWAAPAATDWPLPVRLDAALLDAVLAARGGDDRRAGRILEQALGLAAPDGYRRPFTRAEPGLRHLLTAHLDAGTAHWPMVSELVRVVDVPAESTVAGASVAPLDEPLTERELTILRYLQSILSNVEIAAELSVSVNTVKTHVRNIYRKLDATRRRDAVRRARDLHLI
ncbi:helix-turn-helix transcriptional regulator [Micromonospora zingiberis]|uniref:Helix-turn-helix transcriptional regulator n=1 Tax=Micromonospora zingiberis TaxID=2053011 RepID=A0A4R0GJ54_9ACTN|nr:LuxR C-terminal-related transcriptional regulator [Micromonospora zingiberis]TCB96482.1 helix-turn-helix transcriptional regulator [Micromonospora zingiberis]